MTRSNVKDLPIADNVCEQVLREVERQPSWSIAHVTMNPMAASLLHRHERTTEVYVVTQGYGELIVDSPRPNGSRRPLVAGSAHLINIGVGHMLENKSCGHLEHLVLAAPPFDRADVHLFDQSVTGGALSLRFPPVEDCFDGAKIMSYPFPDLDVSLAFGWVLADPSRHKPPHYHRRITEFAYIVDGQGQLEVDGAFEPIRAGDWIRIDPGSVHGFINRSAEDLVVVCLCSPAFEMADVYYR